MNKDFIQDGVDAAPPAAEGGAPAVTRKPGDAPPPKDVEHDQTAGLGLRAVIGSIMAAGLGVQSSRNRERDFSQGRAGVFIAAGLIFTALFVGAVYTVVTLVLSTR